jgi:glutathione S-transferase
MGMPREGVQYVPELEAKFAPNVCRALEWLEAELKSGPSQGQFLVGTDLTAADIMMGFGIEIIFAMNVGTERQKWPMTNKWLANIMEREAYKKAVHKTGYSL